MSKRISPAERVRRTLDSSRLAVLATTDSDGQPHTSLMAFTVFGGVGSLVVATYRDSLKYRSILENEKVALLIDGRDGVSPGGDVLTARGRAAQIAGDDREKALEMHVARHPDLVGFLRSADCALVGIAVEEYEIVGGIDDVEWHTVREEA